MAASHPGSPPRKQQRRGPRAGPPLPSDATRQRPVSHHPTTARRAAYSPVLTASPLFGVTVLPPWNQYFSCHWRWRLGTWERERVSGVPCWALAAGCHPFRAFLKEGLCDQWGTSQVLLQFSEGTRAARSWGDSRPAVGQDLTAPATFRSCPRPPHTSCPARFTGHAAGWLCTGSPPKGKRYFTNLACEGCSLVKALFK